MRHKDYWIKSAPTTRGRRGIGTTMHGNRMRSISSSIVYHHGSSSPTCMYSTQRQDMCLAFVTTRSTMETTRHHHAYLSPSIDLRDSAELWLFLFASLAPAGRCCCMRKSCAVAQKLDKQGKGGNRPAGSR
jgi:hypothetical protein